MKFDVNNIPPRTKLIIGVVLGLLLVASMVIVSQVARNSRPPDPTATPTLAPTETPIPGPTETPAPTPIVEQALKIYGGQGIYGDNLIKQILALVHTEPDSGEVLPPLTVEAVSMSTSRMVSAQDFTGVDGVFVGDYKYVGDLRKNNPDLVILAEHKAFITKLGMATWWQYLDKLLEAAAIYEAGDGSYHMTPEWQYKILVAQDTGVTWRDLGVDLDGKVDLNSTSSSSSTGIEVMAWMGSCFKPGNETPCTLPLEEDEVDDVAPYLLRYIDMQGGQGSGSLLEFSQWALKGPGNKFFLTYDSTYATSMQTELGFSEQEMKFFAEKPDNYDTPANKKHLVFIYFDMAPYAEHTLVCFTTKCLVLIEKTKLAEISERAYSGLGMTTRAVFFSNPPVSWMTADAVIGEKPTNTTFFKLEEVLNAYLRK